MDSREVAILSSVNELAKKWGLRATDIIANLEPCDDFKTYELVYSYCKPEAAKKEAFSKMLSSLGSHDESWKVQGTLDGIYVALDQAISIAPASRRI